MAANAAVAVLVLYVMLLWYCGVDIAIFLYHHVPLSKTLNPGLLQGGYAYKQFIQ